MVVFISFHYAPVSRVGAGQMENGGAFIGFDDTSHRHFCERSPVGCVADPASGVTDRVWLAVNLCPCTTHR